MKTIASALAMLAFVAVSSAATSNVTLEVKGWTCGSCASATKIALKKLDGVQEVSTDVAKSRVRVRYDDGKVAPQKMVEAIEKIGFKAAVRPDGGAK